MFDQLCSAYNNRNRSMKTIQGHILDQKHHAKYEITMPS